MKRSIMILYILTVNLPVLKAQLVIINDFEEVSAIKDSLFLKEWFFLVDSNHQILPGKTIANNWKPLSSFNLNTYAPAGWVTKIIYLPLNLFERYGSLY